MGAPPHGGFAIGHRALRRAPGRRAEHPRGRRLPEDRQRVGSADAARRRRSRRKSWPSSEFRLAAERLEPVTSRADPAVILRFAGRRSGGEIRSMATEGPRSASQAPALTSLPRVEDLPSVARRVRPREGRARRSRPSAATPPSSRCSSACSRPPARAARRADRARRADGRAAHDPRRRRDGRHDRARRADRLGRAAPAHRGRGLAAPA